MKRIKGDTEKKKKKKKKKKTVAQILLDLRSRLSLIEFLADSNSNSNWKQKRMKSCLEPTPPPTPKNTAAAKGGDHRTTTSPDSPFVIVPSEEYDQKSNQQTSRKKSKKNYSVEIEQLTERKGLLQREMENMKNNYAKLNAYNSELRSIKKEPIRSTHQYPIGPITAHSQPPNIGLGSVNRVGPIGFDLNVPAEETFSFEVVDELQPLDVNGVLANKRARYAEARRIRRGLMKNKSIKNGGSLKIE